MSLSYSLKQTYNFTFLGWLLFKIIKQGPIPEHCAFIVDGNRRFSRRLLSGNLKSGYEMGISVLSQVINLLSDFGIRELTVYVFSQDNYKRKKEEVDIVMSVVLSALLNYEKEIDYLNKLGICFEAIGKWENIPYPGIPEAIARLMLKTRDNEKLKINWAIGYSGRHEILSSAQTIMEALEQKLIGLDDLNEELLQKCFTLKGTRPVDLLIRTGGDTRLSDFLLWTTNDNTCLEFVDVTWPEFGFTHFIKAILNYQKQKLLQSKNKLETMETSLNYNDRQMSFVETFKREKWQNVYDLCKL